MKKLYILLIFLLSIGLWGCDDHEAGVYKGNDFVTFLNKTENKIIRENEDGITEIKIGVAKKSNTDRTFSVTVDAANTTAVEGQDYDFINKNVTIPAGEFVGVIKIKGYYDNLTPEGVKLTLKLNADEALIQAGTTITTTTVNLSRFFEITMDWLEGVWVWTDYDYSTGETTDDDTYLVEITKVSDNKITIYNVWAGGKTINATVDLEEGQIIIDPDQVIYVHSSYGDITMDYFDGQTVKDKDIIGQCTFRGISIAGWTAYTWSGGSYFGRYKSNIVKQE
ncbi:DUF4843 domain-containing protein [Culturomica massiliensis]|uniref:DUF4843 domain-containing protein n=1 Tax=Culturomica massiliensis TaxID=1841857 RepID=UPI003AF1BAB8